MPLQRFTHVGRICSAGAGLRDDHQIQTRQCALHVSKAFPDTAFDPVTNDCVGRHTTRNRQAKPRMSETIGAGMYAEQVVADAFSGAADFAQLDTGAQTQRL